jgi:hypothetical protein
MTSGCRLSRIPASLETRPAEHLLLEQAVRPSWFHDRAICAQPARQILISIIERAVEKVKARVSVLEPLAERDAERRSHRLSFDHQLAKQHAGSFMEL